MGLGADQILIDGVCRFVCRSGAPTLFWCSAVAEVLHRCATRSADLLGGIRKKFSHLLERIREMRAVGAEETVQQLRFEKRASHPSDMACVLAGGDVWQVGKEQLIEAREIRVAQVGRNIAIDQSDAFALRRERLRPVDDHQES